MNSQPTPGPTEAPDDEVRLLLARMRAGDRAAAAEFMDRFGPRMRRRIRTRLAPIVQRQHDVEDILSTVSRRLDSFVSRGRLRAKSESEFWRLLHATADRAVNEKSRMVRARALAEQRHAAAHPIVAPAEAWGRLERAEVDVLVGTAGLPHVDSELVRLHSRDQRLSDIAESLELNACTARKRWQRLLSELRTRLAWTIR